MNKYKTQDYVRTIYVLQKQKTVRAMDIVKRLNVSKPTVSISLKELEKDGYLYVRNDHAIRLTKPGEKLAEDVIESSKVFRKLLIDLGVDEAVASDDACYLERSISRESVLALRTLAECELSKTNSIGTSFHSEQNG